MRFFNQSSAVFGDSLFLIPLIVFFIGFALLVDLH